MDNQTIKNTAISAGAGLGTYYLVKNVSYKIRGKIIKPLMPKVPQDRIENLRNSVNLIMKNEGFENRGIKLVNAANPEYLNNETKKLNVYLYSLRRKMVSTKNPMKKIILTRKHNLEKKLFALKTQALIEGSNGFYSNRPKAQNITLNTKNGIHIFFHEAGHVIDYSNPFLAKLFKNNKNKRLVQFPIFVALITSLATPNKKECQNKKKNWTKKFDTFVKDHCGIFATLGFLPMMACETSANFRGQQLAKKYAPKDIKLLSKVHMFSLLSYWTIPLMAAVSVLSANKVKDSLSEKLKNSDLKIWKS